MDLNVRRASMTLYSSPRVRGDIHLIETRRHQWT